MVGGSVEGARGQRDLKHPRIPEIRNGKSRIFIGQIHCWRSEEFFFFSFEQRT